MAAVPLQGPARPGYHQATHDGAGRGMGAALALAQFSRSPDPGATSAGSAGGGSIAHAALANSVPRLTHRFLDRSECCPESRRCALQAHDVLVDKTQHQYNIVVKTRETFISSGFHQPSCWRNFSASGQRLGRRHVGPGMNPNWPRAWFSVCKGLERDKVCWRGCARDRRKLEGHDGLDGLTLAWNHLQQTYDLESMCMV